VCLCHLLLYHLLWTVFVTLVSWATASTNGIQGYAACSTHHVDCCNAAEASHASRSAFCSSVTLIGKPASGACHVLSCSSWHCRACRACHHIALGRHLPYRSIVLTSSAVVIDEEMSQDFLAGLHTAREHNEALHMPVVVPAVRWVAQFWRPTRARTRC
jgi:hypothetical protein